LKEKRKADKLAQEKEKKDTEDQMIAMGLEIDNLKKELEVREEQELEATKNESILHDLFEQGVIDSDGRLINR
jgi:hypothetical protein